MHFASFRSTRPFDHLPRALDTLRRMGFAVHRVLMESASPDVSLIEVVFQPAGHLDPATFVERLRVMPGVHDVVAGDVCASEEDARTAGTMAVGGGSIPGAVRARGYAA